MELTTNLKLSKPDYDNVCDVVVLDDNFDILDEQFAGNKWVKTVNGVAPVNHNVTVDLGVTSVNGMTGAVTVTERSVPQIIDIVYPVGSYYDTSDTTFDPNVVWGGTWEHVVDGCALIAGGGIYNVGKVYGSATHKLTINELPEHNHGASVSWSGDHAHWLSSPLDEFGFDVTGGGAGPRLRGAMGDNWPYAGSVASGTTQGAGNHTHTVTIGNTGNNIAFDIMQPSLAVARWHRIA